jgi:hypothetical protein
MVLAMRRASIVIRRLVLWWKLRLLRRATIRRLVLWWKLKLLAWKRIIRIVCGCLRLSWHIIASWGWIVVTCARIPRREVLRVLQVGIHGCQWAGDRGT